MGRLKYWRKEEDEAAGEDGRGTRGFPFSNINIVTDSCKNKREKSSMKINISSFLLLRSF